MKKEGFYAVYKGDTFIDLGPTSELALRLGVKKGTIIFWASNSNFNRIKNYENHMISVRIEDDDE